MDRCKERVHDSYGFHSHRCLRNEWKDGYCKQHHPESVEQRRQERQSRFERDMECRQAPYNEITRLRAELDALKARLADAEKVIGQLYAELEHEYADCHPAFNGLKSYRVKYPKEREYGLP